jgi:hypothetical protein
MASGYPRHAHDQWIRTSQRRAGPVQALQQEIPRGADAEELRATHPQRSLGHTDLCTKRWQADPLVNASSQRFLEANHDGGVMVSRLGGIVRLVGGKTMDDRVKEFLLQRSCHLGVLDQVVSGIGESAGLSGKTFES